MDFAEQADRLTNEFLRQQIQGSKFLAETILQVLENVTTRDGSDGLYDLKMFAKVVYDARDQHELHLRRKMK